VVIKEKENNWQWLCEQEKYWEERVEIARKALDYALAQLDSIRSLKSSFDVKGSKEEE